VKRLKLLSEGIQFYADTMRTAVWSIGFYRPVRWASLAVDCLDDVSACEAATTGNCFRSIIVQGWEICILFFWMIRLYLLLVSMEIAIITTVRVIF